MLKSICVCALTLGLGAAGPAFTQSLTEADRPEAPALPTFELLGFPITPVQVQVVGPAHVQEQSPTPTLSLGGIPASPHQVTVLTRRPRTIETAIGAASQ